MSLDNKTLIITGGASGIGLSIATLATGRGANVVLFDHDAAGLAQAVKGLPAGQVVTVSADVTTPEGHKRASQMAGERFGGFDAWINNAGLARHTKIEDYSESQIDLMMDVNIKGTIFGSQEALRHFAPKRSGTIVNIISTASLRGIPGESVYCATKWAVRGFTQALQEEAAVYGVRACSVLPGGVDTPFWDEARDHQVERNAMLAPEDVARAVLGVLEIDPAVVIRELQVRGINDRDFGS